MFFLLIFILFIEQTQEMRGVLIIFNFGGGRMKISLLDRYLTLARPVDSLDRGKEFDQDLNFEDSAAGSALLCSARLCLSAHGLVVRGSRRWGWLPL